MTPAHFNGTHHSWVVILDCDWQCCACYRQEGSIGDFELDSLVIWVCFRSIVPVTVWQRRMVKLEFSKVCTTLHLSKDTCVCNTSSVCNIK